MSKFQNFLTAIIISVLFVTVFNVAIVNLSDNYNRNYDNTSFNSYEKMNNIEEQMDDTRQALNIKEDAGLFDIIGSYFKGGYKALRTAGSSVNLLIGDEGMVDSLFEKLNLGKTTTIFISAFSMLLIVFVIVIFLKSLLRVDI